MRSGMVYRYCAMIAQWQSSRPACCRFWIQFLANALFCE